MENYYKEVDNLFLENFANTKFVNIYNIKSEENELNSYNLSESKKMINILNKAFENKKNKRNNKDNNKPNDLINKLENNIFFNDFQIIKSIYYNKKNLLKNNILNSKNIFNFIKKFKGLNQLALLLFNNNYEFLNDFNKINKKIINYKNEDNNNQLNLISYLKNELLYLEEDKNRYKIQNNNLLLMNKKNFLKFKNLYLNYEMQKENYEKYPDFKKKNIPSLNFFNDLFKLDCQYKFSNEEKKFNFDITNLEIKNNKKIKLINNVIKIKEKKLISIYNNIIFKEKNLMFFKNGILSYFYELIKYDKNFNFKNLRENFSKIESKFFYFKIKINLIIKNKKINIINSISSNKSIEKVNYTKKFNIVKKQVLNKSFEIKPNKYFKNNFIKTIKKKKFIKKKENNINEEFILKLKESDLNKNISDLIILENKIDLSYYNILTNNYYLDTNNSKNIYRMLEFKKLLSLRINLFYKLVKIFGIIKSKNLIINNNLNLLTDFNDYIKNQFRE